MSISTAVQPIVCPPWCTEHWASDEHLGNPNNTFVHQSADVSLPRLDGEEAAQVQLCSILTVEGQEVETSIFIGESSYRMGESRRLAETVLQLVEQAECPPWCVEHLVGENKGSRLHEGTRRWFGVERHPGEGVGVMLRGRPAEHWRWTPAAADRAVGER